MPGIINMGRLHIPTIIFRNTSSREVFSPNVLFLELTRERNRRTIVMNTAVILAALCFASVAAFRPDPLLRSFRNAFPICKDKLNPDRATIRMVKHWEGQGDEKADCLRACILKEAGLLDGSKFNFAALEQMYESDPHANPERTERMIQSVKNCQEKAEVSSDECEVAGKYMACVDEYSPLHHHRHHGHHRGHHRGSPEESEFDDN